MRSRRRALELVLPDVTLSLVADRGVFSASAIDPGTKLLLLETAAPSRDAVHLLDLGCGYGPIATTIAVRAPHATVWAVDVNRRALQLCAENAERNGITNLRAVAPDDVPSNVTLDGIWSNPPIRIGKQALHELLQLWLGRMHTDAHAWLVVQKHLGSDSLAKWLDSVGWSARRHVSRSGYRILDVTRPDS